jgi:hypothetical protein
LTRLQLGERYCLLNSLGEEDVILDRVSHYAEPNIKVSSKLEQGFPIFRDIRDLEQVS